MSERRAHRGLPPRTDQQILDNPRDMALLAAVAAGRVSRVGSRVNAPYLLDGDPLWVDMKRLAREDLIYAPISGPPSLQSRGVRLLQMKREDLLQPPSE